MEEVKARFSRGQQVRLDTETVSQLDGKTAVICQEGHKLDQQLICCQVVGYQQPMLFKADELCPM